MGSEEKNTFMFSSATDASQISGSSNAGVNPAFGSLSPSSSGANATTAASNLNANLGGSGVNHNSSVFPSQKNLLSLMTQKGALNDGNAYKSLLSNVLSTSSTSSTTNSAAGTTSTTEQFSDAQSVPALNESTNANTVYNTQQSQHVYDYGPMFTNISHSAQGSQTQAGHLNNLFTSASSHLSNNVSNVSKQQQNYLSNSMISSPQASSMNAHDTYNNSGSMSSNTSFGSSLATNSSHLNDITSLSDLSSGDTSVSQMQAQLQGYGLNSLISQLNAQPGSGANLFNQLSFSGSHGSTHASASQSLNSVLSQIAQATHGGNQGQNQNQSQNPSHSNQSSQAGQYTHPQISSSSALQPTSGQPSSSIFSNNLHGSNLTNLTNMTGTGNVQNPLLSQLALLSASLSSSAHSSAGNLLGLNASFDHESNSSVMNSAFGSGISSNSTNMGLVNTYAAATHSNSLASNASSAMSSQSIPFNILNAMANGSNVNGSSLNGQNALPLHILMHLNSLSQQTNTSSGQGIIASTSGASNTSNNLLGSHHDMNLLLQHQHQQNLHQQQNQQQSQQNQTQSMMNAYNSAQNQALTSFGHNSNLSLAQQQQQQNLAMNLMGLSSSQQLSLNPNLAYSLGLGLNLAMNTPGTNSHSLQMYSGDMSMNSSSSSISSIASQSSLQGIANNSADNLSQRVSSGNLASDIEDTKATRKAKAQLRRQNKLNGSFQTPDTADSLHGIVTSTSTPLLTNSHRLSLAPASKVRKLTQGADVSTGHGTSGLFGARKAVGIETTLISGSTLLDETKEAAVTSGAAVSTSTTSSSVLSNTAGRLASETVDDVASASGCMWVRRRERPGELCADTPRHRDSPVCRRHYQHWLKDGSPAEDDMKNSASAIRHGRFFMCNHNSGRWPNCAATSQVYNKRHLPTVDRAKVHCGLFTIPIEFPARPKPSGTPSVETNPQSQNGTTDVLTTSTDEMGLNLDTSIDIADSVSPDWRCDGNIVQEETKDDLEKTNDMVVENNSITDLPSHEPNQNHVLPSSISENLSMTDRQQSQANQMENLDRNPSFSPSSTTLSSKVVRYDHDESVVVTDCLWLLTTGARRGCPCNLPVIKSTPFASSGTNKIPVCGRHLQTWRQHSSPSASTLLAQQNTIRRVTLFSCDSCTGRWGDCNMVSPHYGMLHCRVESETLVVCGRHSMPVLPIETSSSPQGQEQAHQSASIREFTTYQGGKVLVSPDGTITSMESNEEASSSICSTDPSNLCCIFPEKPLTADREIKLDISESSYHETTCTVEVKKEKADYCSPSTCVELCTVLECDDIDCTKTECETVEVSNESECSIPSDLHAKNDIGHCNNSTSYNHESCSDNIIKSHNNCHSSHTHSHSHTHPQNPSLGDIFSGSIHIEVEDTEDQFCVHHIDITMDESACSSCHPSHSYDNEYSSDVSECFDSGEEDNGDDKLNGLEKTTLAFSSQSSEEKQSEKLTNISSNSFDDSLIDNGGESALKKVHSLSDSAHDRKISQQTSASPLDNTHDETSSSVYNESFSNSTPSSQPLMNDDVLVHSDSNKLLCHRESAASAGNSVISPLSHEIVSHSSLERLTPAHIISDKKNISRKAAINRKRLDLTITVGNSGEDEITYSNNRLLTPSKSRQRSRSLYLANRMLTKSRLMIKSLAMQVQTLRNENAALTKWVSQAQTAFAMSLLPPPMMAYVPHHHHTVEEFREMHLSGDSHNHSHPLTHNHAKPLHHHHVHHHHKKNATKSEQDEANSQCNHNVINDTTQEARARVVSEDNLGLCETTTNHELVDDLKPSNTSMKA